jgi:hypothetical protein
MRYLRFALPLLILAVPLSAQQPTSTAPPPTSDPQAVALVQRSLAALTGGIAITDVTLTGSAHRIAGSDDETGTATFEATSAGDSRVDLSFASGNRIEIRNHSAMPLPGSLPPGVPASVAQTPQPIGEWVGSDGAPHATANHNIMTPAPWFFPALALEEIATSQNYVLSYIGSETHNGAAALHISAYEQFPVSAQSAPAGPTSSGPPIAQVIQRLTRMDLYLDPTSLVPVALDFNQHPDNNALIDLPVEIRFSGYQAMNGLAVPTQIERYLNDVLILDLHFNNATFNSGLSATSFQLQ